MLLILEYQFPHKQTSSPLKLLKKLRLIAEVKLFHFEDPTYSIDFGTYFGRTAFHLPKKLVENQHTENLIILVPLRFQFPQQFLQNLRGNACVQIIIFKIPYIKMISTLVIKSQSLIFHKNQQRTNMYVQQLRILVPSQILVPLYFFCKP